ncbi:hypothetical protein F5882DRAFT_496295 [Hyaloscypha sp. PMI_1271]|nr:hypothetical protein F5882DRAFT_496295 [Hyaloscypha sp. PMI_1271]
MYWPWNTSLADIEITVCYLSDSNVISELRFTNNTWANGTLGFSGDQIFTAHETSKLAGTSLRQIQPTNGTHIWEPYVLFYQARDYTFHYLTYTTYLSTDSTPKWENAWAHTLNVPRLGSPLATGNQFITTYQNGSSAILETITNCSRMVAAVSEPGYVNPLPSRVTTFDSKVFVLCYEPTEGKIWQYQTYISSGPYFNGTYWVGPAIDSILAEGGRGQKPSNATEIAAFGKVSRTALSIRRKMARFARGATAMESIRFWNQMEPFLHDGQHHITEW